MIRKLYIFIVLTLVGVSVEAQITGATYFYNTPSIYNPSFSGVENYFDVKLGGQRIDLPVSNPPGSNYLIMNYSFQGRMKSRGPKKVRYKSPYDVDKLAGEIPTPPNGLRLSNEDLFRKQIRDSIAKAVRKLDLKEREKLRKKLKKQSFEAAFKHGIGTYALLESTGPFVANTFGLNYAIHLPVSKSWMLAFGGGLRFSNSGLDISKLDFHDPTEPLLEEYGNNNIRHKNLSLTNGIALYTHQFIFSYGIQNALKIIDKQKTSELFDAVSYTRHNFSVFSKIYVEQDWIWQNGLSFGNQLNDSFETVLTSRIIYKEAFSVGGTYDFENRFSLNCFGMVSDFLRVNYIINLPTYSSLQQNAIHEISLNFLISRGSSPSPYFY